VHLVEALSHHARHLASASHRSIRKAHDVAALGILLERGAFFI
jgi:hypothetical protein